MDEEKNMLEMLNESLPDTTAEMLKAKGIPVEVPASTSKKPRLGDTAYTKSWQLKGKAKKNKRKMQKASRKKNRKRRK